MNNLRTLAEAATAGPWTWHEPAEAPQWGKRGPDLVSGSNKVILSAEGDGDGVNLFVSGPNAAFIAAADPQTILALFEELDRLRANAKDA